MSDESIEAAVGYAETLDWKTETEIAARRAELLDKVKNYHRDVEELATLREQNQVLREALDTLVAVVGLTAFKHETQRAVLQEAVDGALKALGRERK